MKTNKTFVFASLLLVSSISAQAAGGGIQGGGGDFRCAEYSDLAQRISETLILTGQEKVVQVSSAIQVSEIERVARNLVCLPVETLDRQARSYPDGHTDLLVTTWEELDRRQKVRLTSHELCVIAGYEKDGEYSVSDKMLEILQTSPKPLLGSSHGSASDSNTGSVSAYPKEIASHWQNSTTVGHMFTTYFSLTVRKQEVARFSASTKTFEEMTRILNRILLNAGEGQKVRIDLKNAPNGYNTRTVEHFADLFQIENDI